MIVEYRTYFLHKLRFDKLIRKPELQNPTKTIP